MSEAGEVPEVPVTGETGEVPGISRYVQSLNDNAFRSRIYGGGGSSPLVSGGI